MAELSCEASITIGKTSSCIPQQLSTVRREEVTLFLERHKKHPQPCRLSAAVPRQHRYGVHRSDTVGDYTGVRGGNISHQFAYLGERHHDKFALESPGGTTEGVPRRPRCRDNSRFFEDVNRCRVTATPFAIRIRSEFTVPRAPF